MLDDNEAIYQYQPLWDKWHIDGLIGSGSFGKVFRISYEEFGHVYESAVKIISIPAASPDPAVPQLAGADENTLKNYFHEMVQSLVNEVDILYSLSGNSNILGYHDHKIIEHQGPGRMGYPDPNGICQTFEPVLDGETAHAGRGHRVGC